MAFRFSTRPHKQFLWLLIRRDSRLSKGKQLGLDVGCADMRNKRFFQTNSYIGLDMDSELLCKGKSMNPTAETVNSSILDAPKIEADFIQCIQVFVNADFVKEEAVAATRKLISFVRPGGVLLMNTGRQTIQYDEEIGRLLNASFDEVVEVRYGNFGVRRAPLFFSLLIALVMYCVPQLRTMGGHSKTYYKCLSKKPS